MTSHEHAGLAGRTARLGLRNLRGRREGAHEYFSCRWARPANNQWGTWLLQIAPSVVEMSGGKDDGGTVFDFVDVDLLALPKCLDEVEAFTYDPDNGNEPHLTLEGKKGKREIVVEVYITPFEDDEPSTVFDVNIGGWRDKQEDTD
jgi:hypothetical protein